MKAGIKIVLLMVMFASYNMAFAKIKQNELNSSLKTDSSEMEKLSSLDVISPVPSASCNTGNTQFTPSPSCMSEHFNDFINILSSLPIFSGMRHLQNVIGSNQSSDFSEYIELSKHYERQPGYSLPPLAEFPKIAVLWAAGLIGNNSQKLDAITKLQSSMYGMMPTCRIIALKAVYEIAYFGNIQVKQYAIDVLDQVQKSKEIRFINAPISFMMSLMPPLQFMNFVISQPTVQIAIKKINHDLDLTKLAIKSTKPKKIRLAKKKSNTRIS
jgi:hypothetical protein